MAGAVVVAVEKGRTGEWRTVSVGIGECVIDCQGAGTHAPLRERDGQEKRSHRDHNFTSGR